MEGKGAVEQMLHAIEAMYAGRAAWQAVRNAQEDLLP
jgi:hypothetical protein